MIFCTIIEIDGENFELVCDIPYTASKWPNWYPEYDSPKGWELEKLDAKMEVLNGLVNKHTEAGNATLALTYLVMKNVCSMERSVLLHNI